jgi:hypothetical protein
MAAAARVPPRPALRRPRLARRPEDPATAALIRRLGHVRAAGRFTRAELLLMCRWKSPRAEPRCRRNSAAAVRRLSARALAARGERRRMELLLGLEGVGVPMASAILTLIDPRRYGVLDIRVWRLLFARGAVRTNRAGRGFTVGQWLDYLARLRAEARARRWSCRALEWALFHAHRRRFPGRLYDPRGA